MGALHSDYHTINHKMKTPLPLFYLHNSDLASPKVIFSKKYKKRKTTSRLDKKIEEVPFLKSIKAYQYKS